MEVEKKIKSLIEKPLNEKGFIIDNIVYLKEEGQMFLRIFIDKKGVIDIDDCVLASNLINPILDKEDPIEESYILDVCSKEGSDENEY